jgi:hypothetical protein
MEDTMYTIRQEKYQGMVERAASQAIEQLEKGFKYEVYATQKWDDGFFKFWPQKWLATNSKNAHPTLDIAGLRLEHLLSDDPSSEAPNASIWLKDMKKAGWDMEELKKRILAEIKPLLKGFPKLENDDDPQCIYYYLPEGKVKIRKLLLEDEEGFVSLLASHAVHLAELAPAITKVLAAKRK